MQSINHANSKQDHLFLPDFLCNFDLPGIKKLQEQKKNVFGLLLFASTDYGQYHPQ